MYLLCHPFLNYIAYCTSDKRAGGHEKIVEMFIITGICCTAWRSPLKKCLPWCQRRDSVADRWTFRRNSLECVHMFVKFSAKRQTNKQRRTRHLLGGGNKWNRKHQSVVVPGLRGQTTSSSFSGGKQSIRVHKINLDVYIYCRHERRYTLDYDI